MKIRTVEKGIHLFFCPGCKCGHWFSTSGFTASQPEEDTIPKGPVWTWNNDIEKPTVRASILVLGGTGGQVRCHSFITDGKIEFLSDSNHDLKGKTVELEDF